MKKRLLMVAGLTFSAGLLTGLSAQSLGDAARASRKTKQPVTHVYTNENLPTDAPITVTGPPPSPTATEANARTEKKSATGEEKKASETAGEDTAKSKTSEDKDSATDGSKSKPQDSAQPGDKDQTAAKGKDNPSDDDPKAAHDKLVAEWKTKLADQNKEIDLLARELDVLQREYRLRAVAFYSDAGNRLRNQQQWSQDDQQYRQRIADKQKQLQDAKQKLEELTEQARKEGFSATE